MDAATAGMLTRYKQWSNRVMFDALTKLPEGEALKPRPSLFKNMVHTLNHNYVIDRIWQAHLEGREHGYEARNTKDHPPLEELARLQDGIDDWYVGWADTQSAASLAEVVHYTLVGGNQGAMSRGEILLHLAMHTNYHRGFVSDMIYGVAGHRPPTMDLPVYMREGVAPQA